MVKAWLNAPDVRIRLAESRAYGEEIHDPDSVDLKCKYRSRELRDLATKLFPDPRLQLCVDASSDLDRRFVQFASERKFFINDKRKLKDMVSVDAEMRRENSLIASPWGYSILDGTSQFESSGYFDARCIPPWDTWLDIGRIHGIDIPCLLSWVPERVLDSVDGAVGIEAGDCLFWVRFENDQFYINDT